MARLGIPRATSWLARFTAVVALAAIGHGMSARAVAEPVARSLERDVWPILAVYCTNCHGGDAPKGDLDLRSVAAMLRGGESGPALARFDPDGSLLLRRIVAGEIPPPKERRPSREEIVRVRDWIQTGAAAEHLDAVPPAVSPVSETDRHFWSFRPLAVVDPPPLDAARTPVDAFLLDKLRAEGLTFSPEADRTTLLRRACLDLLGLPPSPEEADEFLADHEPGAFERLIDRLLASPHFGERFGRHWLDLAGYVDTVGFDVDATNVITSEGKWRYRDYVIRAFNEDKPYDRFITEQLAGDELFDWRHANRFTPQMREALIATGYLRTARDLTHEDVGVIPQNFYGIMHDTLEIVGTGLLGLTLNCARCHNHKFDPIPQEDYYRLMAILAPSYNRLAWRPVIKTETNSQVRGLPDVSHAEQSEIERHNAEIDRQIEPLRNSLEFLRRPHEARLAEAKIAALPEAIRVDVKTAVGTAADKRTAVQKYLAEKFATSLKVTPEQVAADLGEAERATVEELEGAIASAQAQHVKWGTIQALYEVGPPPPTHLLVRGSEQTPGAEVQPGFLRVLSRSDADAMANATAPAEGTSGRRTALARWLTEASSPGSALLSRVMVNRVWQQLFGRGIVPTSENFGAQGLPPTHPELLEWLSGRFIEGGWRVKPLVKEIVMSAAYRQASRRDSASMSAATSAAGGSADPEAVDPADDLLWRMRLRRLESEVVRDSILAVSGQLNRTMGGPPVPISAQPGGMVVVAKDRLARASEAGRRSVYLLTRRAYNLSLLTVFDQPLVATNCLARDASAVPLQSLAMLNSAFVAEQAEHFATRIEHRGATTADERIEAAFRLALARGPNALERATCRDLLDRQADILGAEGAASEAAAHRSLAEMCHVLLNTSEFLYAE